MRQIALYDKNNKTQTGDGKGSHIYLILKKLGTVDLIPTSLVSKDFYRFSIELIRQRITPLQDRYLRFMQSLTDKMMVMERMFRDETKPREKNEFKMLLKTSKHYPGFFSKT